MGVTWNPSDKHANINLSNGNLTATSTNYANKSVRATKFFSAGKFYFEYTCDVRSSGANYHHVGWADSVTLLTTMAGASTTGDAWASRNDNKIYHDNSYDTINATWTQGDIVMVAIDFSAGKIWIGVNGIWADGDPSTGTGEQASGVGGTLTPIASIYRSADAGTANFGASAFAYTIPSGFLSPSYSGYFDGYVYEQSSPIVRMVCLHSRSDGSLKDTTTSSGNGYYYLETDQPGSHYIVCLDDPAGEDYNDLIIGDVYPTDI